MPVSSMPGPRESRRSRPYAWPAPGPFRSTGSRANPMVFLGSLKHIQRSLVSLMFCKGCTMGIWLCSELCSFRNCVILCVRREVHVYVTHLCGQRFIRTDLRMNVLRLLHDDRIG